MRAETKVSQWFPRWLTYASSWRVNQTKMRVTFDLGAVLGSCTFPLWASYGKPARRSITSTFAPKGVPLLCKVE